jgi:hypothetical protein
MDLEAHHLAMEKRSRELDAYLAAHADEPCRGNTFQPSFVFIYVKGGIELERLVERVSRARSVEYHNMGRLLPNERADRVPYFIDPAHLSDKGADALGKFYAEQILAADQAYIERTQPVSPAVLTDRQQASSGRSASRPMGSRPASRAHLY